MSDSRWYFTEEQLANSPSRKCGINADLELSYRQRAANLIQEMGQRLQVSQLCINTAIVYMHRFYAFHSFTMFHRNSIAAAAFFLAAKVEEQPRKLEHVIKVLNLSLEKTDIREAYAEQAQELVLNENILLQTLGFDVAIDHPHTHVVKACQLFNIVTVSRELRQTCYFMASNSLHLTTMCLKYRPTVVAAFCIYIACKWSRWEIPDSSEGKAWYSYVDDTVTLDTLKKLTEEYLQILERSPSKFKSKMKAITSNGQAGVNQSPGIDVPSTSHHKNQHHEKHHHHHHHKNQASMSNNATNSMNANGNSRSSSSSSSAASKAQMATSSQQQYKAHPSQSGVNSSIPQPPLPTASTTNHNLHRSQRPPSSQQGYSSSSSNSNNNNSSNSQAKPPPLLDERSQQQQRLMHQDQGYQRIPEHPKHRTSSSNNSAPPIPPPQQQPPLPQQQQPPQPYMKMGMSDQQKQQQQQHNLMSNSSAKQTSSYPVQGMDLHQKNIKQNPATDYHSSNSRNNAMNPQLNQQQQQIQNNPQKKQQPPWSQQQLSHSQDKQQQQQQQQYMHQQKNLQIPHSATNVHDQSASNSNMMMQNNSSTKSQNLSAYNNMSSKHQQQQHSSATVVSQNDFWFNDKKINELSNKTVTPPRQTKSLFSPSPEHDSGLNETEKFMLMTGSLKRSQHENVQIDSPKEMESSSSKKSSTPSKRDKNSMLMNQSQQNQKHNNPPLPPSATTLNQQIDSKKFSSNIPPLPPNMADMTDPQMLQKKRPYSSIKDSSLEAPTNRENKVRKVEQIKSDSNIPSSLPATPLHPMMMSKSSSQPPINYGEPIPTKQPIETTPDIVKSLLAECFSSSNKFDAYDTDSPLDVINPELPEQLLATTSSSTSHGMSSNSNKNGNVNSIQQQQQVMIKNDSLEDLLDIKDDKMGDSSAGESSSRKDKKKSKKKKEKHKHKKKHKSSDREDKSDSSSLKIILNKTDTKSSPESYAGGLKIKIPINKEAANAVAAAAAAAAAAGSGIKSNDVNPAPIKLKISKEKFGNFSNNNNSSNNNNNTSSSSSSSSHHHKSKKDKDRDKSKSKSSKHYNSSDYKESSSYQHSN